MRDVSDYEAHAKHAEHSQHKELKPFVPLTEHEKDNIEYSKSSSTSTLYADSTIHVPDVDRIMLSVGLLLEQMIEEPPPGDDLFNPPPTLKSRRASKRSAERCSAKDVYRFMQKTFTLAQW
jgi:hypothetical protein